MQVAESKQSPAFFDMMTQNHLSSLGGQAFGQGRSQSGKVTDASEFTGWFKDVSLSYEQASDESSGPIFINVLFQKERD
jgi:hypothetical protein